MASTITGQLGAARRPKAPTPAPATAAESPAVAGAPKVETKKGVKKSTNKAVAERLASEMAAEYNPNNVAIGSKSGSIEFVELIGDPSIVDNADLKDDKTGVVTTRTFPRIIGYRFRALEEVEVPDFGATDDFNGDRLNTAADLSRWKTVKKGEVFDLTRVEAGALLSKPEFGTIANGGGEDKAVKLRVSFAKIKNNIKSALDLPSISLTMVNGSSIKEFPIIPVLDYTKPPKGEKKGIQVGKRVCRPEFVGTKWEKRASDMSRRAGRRGVSPAKNEEKTHKVIGAAFQNLLKQAAEGQAAAKALG